MPLFEAYLRDGRFGVRITAQAILFIYETSGPALSFPEMKGPEHEFELLPLSTAKLKSEWRYASTPTTCLYDMDTEKFTFL